MKLLIIISIALSLVGCHISRSFQPTPEGFEMYYKNRHNDTPSETVKRDMLACGFPNVYNNVELIVNDENSYAKATLCMEKKGYKTSNRGGICEFDSFKNTEACQKHLGQ